jgi:hypothetical protein
MIGMTALLMQYFKKGWAVVARNLICRVCSMNVVMFQLMIKPATAKPTKAVLNALTLP